MRYVRIFLLYAQDVIEYRSLALVWFLVSLVSPLLYLLFWRGAITQSHPSGFTSLSDVTSYYFLYLIVGGFLMTHIEHEVANVDIKEGGLVKYILKPMSYIAFKFFLELAWRVAMGLIAIITTLVIFSIFGKLFTISLSPTQIGIVVLISLLGLAISFIFKMIVGMSALWVVDFAGIEQLVFAMSLLFSGFIVPLDMFPSYLKTVSSFLPIQYTVYYPIRALQGKLTLEQSFSVIAMQVLWILVLAFGYKLVWKNGIKRFTGVGL